MKVFKTVLTASVAFCLNRI